MARMSDTVLVLCDDLLFWSKIQGAAKAAGITVMRTRDGAVPPGVRRVLVDLQAGSLDPDACALAWKSAPHCPQLIAFASHVDVDAQARAREAGFDRVLSRSVFVRELPALLRLHPGDPGPPASSPA
jgi:CheY-like chemotaxis protein